MNTAWFAACGIVAVVLCLCSMSIFVLVYACIIMWTWPNSPNRRINWCSYLASTRRVRLLVVFVCLSVCLFVRKQDYLKSNQICTDLNETFTSHYNFDMIRQSKSQVIWITIRVARNCIKLLPDVSRAKEQTTNFGRCLQFLTDCLVSKWCYCKCIYLGNITCTAET